jgi:hypothetical protein
MWCKLGLNIYQVIVALSLVGVIWLSILFSVMVYNFELVNVGIIDNENLIKGMVKEALNKTDTNRDHLLRQDAKLDKLLNQTSDSNK